MNKKKSKPLFIKLMKWDEYRHEWTYVQSGKDLGKMLEKLDYFDHPNNRHKLTISTVSLAG